MRGRDRVGRGQALLELIPASTSAASAAPPSPTSPVAQRQGASTIAEQFVKNALAEQGNRTIVEKLREAAMAYHLTHEWPRWQILTQYLNSIYFGNGAYGVESAARVYFGKSLGYDPNAAGERPSSGVRRRAAPPACASVLAPCQAALLAGMVANPSAFNPIAFPQAAMARRDLVLYDMRQQGYISRTQYDQAQSRSRCQRATRSSSPRSHPRRRTSRAGCGRRSWDAMGGDGCPPQVAEYRAYYGGLKIRTTIDLPMQRPPSRRSRRSCRVGPTSRSRRWSRSTTRPAQVRAMVGGPMVNGQEDYERFPFNIATKGQRQPGSAFKPFTLAVALEQGYRTRLGVDSKPLNLFVPNSGGKEHFLVQNFGNEYSGPITLGERDRGLGQQRVRPAGLDGRHEADRAGWQTRWGSARRSRPTPR